MREFAGFLSPTQGSADNKPAERRAGHGLGARAGLVVRPDCVFVLLEVDLASVALEGEGTGPG